VDNFFISFFIDHKVCLQPHSHKMNPNAASFNPNASAFVPSWAAAPTPAVEQPAPTEQPVKKPSPPRSAAPKAAAPSKAAVIPPSNSAQNLADKLSKADLEDAKEHCNLVFIGHVDGIPFALLTISWKEHNGRPSFINHRNGR
jgi:hypothetical protein